MEGESCYPGNATAPSERTYYDLCPSYEFKTGKEMETNGLQYNHSILGLFHSLFSLYEKNIHGLFCEPK